MKKYSCKDYNIIRIQYYKFNKNKQLDREYINLFTRFKINFVEYVTEITSVDRFKLSCSLPIYDDILWTFKEKYNILTSQQENYFYLFISKENIELYDWITNQLKKNNLLYKIIKKTSIEHFNWTL